MVNIFRKIEKFVKKENLIKEGDKILLAVSGGPDSVFLFHFFIYLLKKRKIDIKVTYIHHHLRKEADKEVEFVKNLSNIYGIEFIREDIKIEEKKNIEKTLREKRYKKLFEIAIKTGCNKIATGHTLDDHIETFFINFFRGSGLSGLCGIWSKSNIFPESEVVIVRPLLCIEKKEILNYLKENKIEYMIDKSNLSLNFFRNRIRNEIIPFLLKYRPSLKKIILRMTEIIKTEEKFLKNYTEQILKEISKREGEKIIIDLEKFMKLEDAIKKRVAGYIYKEIEKTPYVNSNKIEKIVKSIEKGEKILGKKILDRILKNEKEKKKSFVVSINIPGETKILNKFIVESEIIPFSEKIFRNTDKFTGYFDFSKINGIIIVRNRKIGDRFIPLGLKKEKKISRFMIDKKIPQFQRDEILIFENNGKIMWLCGYEISEEFKVDKNTKKVLKIHVKY